jgi:hypothetical protein
VALAARTSTTGRSSQAQIRIAMPAEAAPIMGLPVATNATVAKKPRRSTEDTGHGGMKPANAPTIAVNNAIGTAYRIVGPKPGPGIGVDVSAVLVPASVEEVDIVAAQIKLLAESSDLRAPQSVAPFGRGGDGCKPV